MKTLILSDKEFKLINTLFEIAYKSRGKINDNPLRKFIEEMEPLLDAVDADTRNQFMDLRRRMDEENAATLRDMDSIKHKMMVLESQNEQ